MFVNPLCTVWCHWPTLGACIIHQLKILEQQYGPVSQNFYISLKTASAVKGYHGCIESFSVGRDEVTNAAGHNLQESIYRYGLLQSGGQKIFYTWGEHQQARGANQVASALEHFVYQQLSPEHHGIKKILLVSDSC